MPFARALLERCGPIAGTTANPRGGARYRGDGDRSMLPAADLLVEHGPTRYDSESSIVDLIREPRSFASRRRRLREAPARTARTDRTSNGKGTHSTSMIRSICALGATVGTRRIRSPQLAAVALAATASARRAPLRRPGAAAASPAPQPPRRARRPRPSIWASGRCTQARSTQTSRTATSARRRRS